MDAIARLVNIKGGNGGRKIADGHGLSVTTSERLDWFFR